MRKLKEKSGAAMIAVLCILAIFLTLCLSMLLTASVLMQNANNRMYEEQCRVSAVTMSKELEENLCFPDEGGTAGFYSYIKNNMALSGPSSWPYLNPDELGHGENSGVYRSFELENADTSGTGAVTVKLYWEWERGGLENDVVLHVDVTARKNRSEHTIRTAYNLDAKDGAWAWSLTERS